MKVINCIKLNHNKFKQGIGEKIYKRLLNNPFVK